MVAPSGKEVKIIQNIAAKWKAVGIHFNFDPNGNTINLIDARHPLNPEACCTDIVTLWLEGKGRNPATWATLVKVLRNTEFNVLADEVEQLVSMAIESGETVSMEPHPTTGECVPQCICMFYSLPHL